MVSPLLVVAEAKGQIGLGVSTDDLHHILKQLPNIINLKEQVCH